MFPLRPRGKEPLTKNGLHDATTDPAQIEAWWSKHPDANVAVRTGDAFDVLDLDGPEAVSAFKEWCVTHNVEPASIRKAVSKTSKGWHYLFAPSGVGNRARMLGAPIDWRGRGGYVVVPPSVHPSGARYEWKIAAGGDLPEVPAALRDLLDPPVVLRHVEPTLQRTSFEDNDDGHAAYLKAAYDGELARIKDAREGERNATLFSVLCNVIELCNSGLDQRAVDDVCDAARAIGLPDKEVDRTLTSAYTKAGSNVRELPAARTPPARTQPRATRPETGLERTHSSDVAQTPATGSRPVLRPDPAVFTGFLGECVMTLDPWTEADPVGVLGTLLAGVGCAIGRAPHALVSTTRHPLLIWPLLLGRTSTGRKGTAHDMAESLLHYADPAFVTGNITGGLSSGEGLIHVVRDPTYERHDNPEEEPKLIDPGVDDKRRLIVETEFGGTMARAKREGSSLSAVLRQAWDGKTLATLTKSSVISTGSHLSIAAHVTPREFLMRLRDSDLVGGTYNRFLPLLIHRSKILPEAPTPPADVMEALGYELRKRMDNARRVSWVPRTESASALWRELYAELSSGEDEDDRLGQFVARSVPYTLRLSVLWALMDGERHVQPQHLEAAASLVRFSIASVGELLRSPLDQRREALTAALRDAGARGLTRTEVNGVFAGKLTAPELDELLERVPGLEVHKRSTGGRPITAYVVPPTAEKGSEEGGRSPHEG